METIAFRFIVRGNDGTGRRMRRTKVHHAVDYSTAWSDFASHYKRMSRGLTDPTYSVLPPAGYLVRGGVGARFVEAA